MTAGGDGCEGGATGRRHNWRRYGGRRLPLDRLELLRLPLDRAQGEPARERRDVDVALRRRQRAAQRQENIGPGAGHLLGAGENNAAVDGAIGQVERAANGDIGSLAFCAHIGEPDLPGADREIAFEVAHRQPAAGQCIGREALDARRFDRLPLIHRPRHRREGSRIERREFSVPKSHAARALQRAEQRLRTAPGALDVNIKTKPSGDRRPRSVRQKRRDVGIGQRELALRRETLRRLLEGEPSGQAPAGNGGGELLERQLVAIDAQSGA